MDKHPYCVDLTCTEGTCGICMYLRFGVVPSTSTSEKMAAMAKALKARYERHHDSKDDTAVATGSTHLHFHVHMTSTPSKPSKVTGYGGIPMREADNPRHNPKWTHSVGSGGHAMVSVPKGVLVPVRRGSILLMRP